MLYSKNIGLTWSGGTWTNSANGLDNTRRTFSMSDAIATLNIQASPFFAYLAKLRKRPVKDTVFKMLQARPQWQRRTFYVQAAQDNSGDGVDLSSLPNLTIKLATKYDKFGRLQTTDQAPQFLLPNQLFVLTATDHTDNTKTYRITFRIKSDATITVGSTYTTLNFQDLETKYVVETDGSNYGTVVSSYPTVDFATTDKGEVIGSAFAEGTGAPDSWRDELVGSEGYTGILKTASPMFTGSTLSTEYRGSKDEFMRVWRQKLLEHRDDLTRALLFNVGKAGDDEVRMSWGIIPYIETFGSIYNINATSVTYDDFLEIMEYLASPENGASTNNKLVICGSSWIRYLNSLDSGGFVGTGLGSLAKQLNIQNYKGKFGHNVTGITTPFGSFNFVAEPQLKGIFSNLAIIIDFGNLYYRPLAGNGRSRDTFIKTNVQDNDVDGRIDMILTEAGLQIDMVESFALMNLTNFDANSYYNY